MEKFKKRIELLAPAGDKQSFVAAVENGADAVYFGGKLFNARQNAGNFDIEDFEQLFHYAHARGVKAYLAMNTLIDSSEFSQALEFAGSAYLKGIDGIIVQDIGFASVLKKDIPELDLHGSTQMTVYNVEGVRMLENMGFKRAVLARELSIEEIENIVDKTSLEIEIFGHGALCISYSGQCLMSSIIGGRSGNRGKCAQPCRLKYRVVDGKNNYSDKSDIPRYLMSPKDLCSIYKLKDIINAKVSSLKIEGRMKGMEYVATVVRIYRKYIDLLYESHEKSKEVTIQEIDIKHLTQIFNRGGFTTGYLEGKKGKDMMCFDKPKNWGIYLGEVISYDYNKKSIKVKLEDTISIGDGIEVWNGCDESPGTVVTAIIKGKDNVKSSDSESTAWLGHVVGKITKGDRVYKTSDKTLKNYAVETSRENTKKVRLKAEISVKKGQSTVLKVIDEDGNMVEVLDDILPEEALNKPLTCEAIDKQLRKTGNTFFEIKDVKVLLDEGISLRVSRINKLRRIALTKMEEKRTFQNERSIKKDISSIEYKVKYDKEPKSVSKTIIDNKAKISLLFYKWQPKYNKIDFGADRMYIPFDGLDKKSIGEMVEFYHKRDCELHLYVPPIVKGNLERLFLNNIEYVVNAGVDGVMAGSPSIIEHLQSTGTKIHADHYFNVFNRYSAEKLKNLGLNGFTFSLELTLSRIKDFANGIDFEKESVVYGRIPLMISEYCPVGNSMETVAKKISKCKGMCKAGTYSLKDRKGMEFPIICDRTDCRSTVLNSEVLFIPDTLRKLAKSGVDIYRICVYDESIEEIQKLVSLHKSAVDGIDYQVKHAKLIEKIKQSGFTKGHYYRGV